MSRRRFAALALGGALFTGAFTGTFAAAQSDHVTLTLSRATAEELHAALGEALATTTTTQATTTTAPETTTTTTTLPPTTTTTVAPTTTTTAPAPSVCNGVQVPAGANLATVAANHPAGTTFCLAAGTYSLVGTSGMPLQDGDSVIGALGSNGERLSILTGGDSVRRAFNCTCSPALLANFVMEHFDDGKERTQPMGPSLTGVTWDNIESRFNGGRGMYTWDGNTVRNSYIHHNGEVGFAGSGDNVLIEGNEVAFNNPDGQTFPGREAGGSKFTNAVGVIVRGNHFYRNCGAAIWFDGSGNRDVLIEGNVSEDNWGVGIFLELFGDDGVVRFNEVSRNSFGKDGVICQNTPGGESTGAGNGGMRISGASDVEAYENVLVDNDGGISSTQDDRKASTGLYVHDNEITWTAGWHGMQKTGGNADPFSSGANNRYENNVYHYEGSSSEPFKWAGDDRSWTAWQGFGHDDTGSFD